jgi:hypothetical protein
MSGVGDGDGARCGECGARRVEGLSCWEQFGWVVAWEAQDPELLAEHFLTVACYNIQHPAQFTDEVITGLQAALKERLDEGVPVEVIRRRNSKLYEGKKRVLKREAERRPVLRRWPMTIADVYIPEQPEGAAERVRRWAAAIRSEL